MTYCFRDFLQENDHVFLNDENLICPKKYPFNKITIMNIIGKMICQFQLNPYKIALQEPLFIFKFQNKYND